MKILIIGGTGHIGANLTRLLAEDGDDVVVMSRGQSSNPATRDGVHNWVTVYSWVNHATLDYKQSLADGSFLALLKDEQPDVVVDILASDIGSVANACREADVSHLMACGSLWMLGRPKVVPTPETTFEYCPFPDYQYRWTQLSQVMAWAKVRGLAFTAILPPNICGPGKIPLDGHGGRSLAIHQLHQRGVPVILPYPDTYAQ